MPMREAARSFGTWWCVLALGVGLFGAGCKSTKVPGVDALVSIHIDGQEPLAIARAVSAGFKAEGFEAVVLPPGGQDYRMQFERQGSLTTTLVWGDWSSKDIYYRAKVKIIRVDSNRHLVTCDVFRVLHRGDKHFEEEHALYGMNSGPYQDILKRAKAELEKGNPAAGAK
jgi:hypothetical protein